MQTEAVVPGNIRTVSVKRKNEFEKIYDFLSGKYIGQLSELYLLPVVKFGSMFFETGEKFISLLQKEDLDAWSFLIGTAYRLDAHHVGRELHLISPFRGTSSLVARVCGDQIVVVDGLSPDRSFTISDAELRIALVRAGVSVTYGSYFFFAQTADGLCSFCVPVPD